LAPSQNAPLRLTPRQTQVLRLLAEGKTSKEIARALNVSARTVRAHTDALRMKLGVANIRQIPFVYRSVTGLDPLSDEFVAAADDSNKDMTSGKPPHTTVAA
jgi:DNA-binding NarL/FixJ family response regulator